MQTVNNNKPEQINSALFAISDDITKQNIQTRNEIKSSEAAMQKQIDKLTDSLKNNGGLITGGTYNINISGNASTATNATNATNADKATQDSAGNTITATYVTKTELDKKVIPTKTSQLTNDSGYITSSGSITGNAATATKATTADKSNRTTGISYTGESYACISAQQTQNSFNNSEADWASYIICNHYDGQAYYHQMLRFSFFSDSIQLQRRVNGNLQGWKNVAIIENSYSWPGKQTFTGGIRIPTSAPSSPAPGDIWIE